MYILLYIHTHVYVRIMDFTQTKTIKCMYFSGCVIIHTHRHTYTYVHTHMINFTQT
jgi:hypothetical protein